MDPRIGCWLPLVSGLHLLGFHLLIHSTNLTDKNTASLLSEHRQLLSMMEIMHATLTSCKTPEATQRSSVMFTMT